MAGTGSSTILNKVSIVPWFGIGQVASIVADGPPPLATFAYDAAGRRTSRFDPTLHTNRLCLHHARHSSPRLLNFTGYTLAPRFITMPSNTSVRAWRLIDRSDS